MSQPLRRLRIALPLALVALAGACCGPAPDDGGRESSAAPAGGVGALDDLSSWTKPSDAELRARLTPLQYDVTQEEATEPPFKNAYWDNHADGIYVDVVSGEPLFSSKHKFESGTGWPSFWQPLRPGNLATDVDHKLGYARDEVRSRRANSHLGHVFHDGPKPTGLRYCINSAALRFIPADRLAAEGYGEFAADFER